MAVGYVMSDSRLAGLETDFAQANNFTEVDVLTNRENKISNAQMIRLSLQAVQPFFSAVVTLVGWMIFVQVMQTFLPSVLQMVVFGKMVSGGTVLFLGCVWAVIVGFLQSSKLTLLLLMDVTKGQTACIEGRVSPSVTEEEAQGLDRFHGDKKCSYRYAIQKFEVEVNEAGYELLHSKYDQYRPKARIYYTPKSQMLLSLEIL